MHCSAKILKSNAHTATRNPTLLRERLVCGTRGAHIIVHTLTSTRSHSWREGGSMACHVEGRPDLHDGRRSA